MEQNYEYALIFRGHSYGYEVQATAKLFIPQVRFLICENGEIKTETNNHGGILGGISSGMPIVFRCAIKPTPSIAKEQKSVNIMSGEAEKLVIGGRHDPCIVPRAVPCVEAAAAIAIADYIF